jgi:capsular exopolysaccharide synthesis family protein
MAPEDRTTAADTSAEIHDGIPPILTAMPTAGALLRALRRRWLLALIVALVGGAAAAFAAYTFIPAPHVASVNLQLHRPPDYMAGAAEGGTLDDFIRSQSLVIRSPRVVNGAMASEEVRGLAMVQQQGDDTSWLAKALTGKPLTGENTIPLKLSGEDPDELKIFLAALVNSYLDSLRAERRVQLFRYQQNLEKIEIELADLMRKLPFSEKRELEVVNNNLFRARIDLRRAESDLRALKDTPASINRRALDLEIDAELKGDVRAQNLLVRMVKLQVQIADVEFRGSNSDSRLANLRGQLKPLQDDLEVLRKGAEGKLKGQLLLEAENDRKKEIAKQESRVQSLKDEEKLLMDQAANLEGTNDPKMRAMDARRKALETLRAQTLDRMIRIERDGDEVPWVRTMGRPSVGNTRDHSQQLKLGGAGVVGVIGLLLFGVALVEFRGRRIATSDDITYGLGIPTAGTLPLLPARARRQALESASPRHLHWEGRLTEAVDALRTFLLHSLGEGPHVILVTSAVAGEGKTSLASQLAASLARAWRKTLLIDGDLRKPAAHALFSLQADPGLSEVLRGELEATDAVKPTAVSRLWMMPAGVWDAHAQQALAQEGVANLFEQLKDEYDVIVVDSCPVLPVADTLQLGQHVDTVLLSAMRGTSRLPTLYAARQRLAALDIPVLGTVFVGGSSSLGGLDIQYPHPTSR